MLKRFGIAVAVIGFLLGSLALWIVLRQGVSSAEFEHRFGKSVVFDDHGIPTIQSSNWGRLIEMQGFTTAADRLWQMDLIRRRASGRLSEWFGEVSLSHDIEMVSEARLEVAAKAAKAMPRTEWFHCDAYARGVNQFIGEFPNRWGIEYLLLGVEPEPWSCEDSILVLISMADSLTANAKRETYMQAWKENISSEWWQFLFSREHPWNVPIFGQPKRTKVPLPPKSQFLPVAPIDPQKFGGIRQPQSPVGSNNWAYRGTKGAFLANDPHLQQSIPSIWYASRLILSETDWIVGVAVPGLPGITIGMNPHVAWAFTNTNEDVDDYIEEAVSDDHIYYRVRGEGGVEVWEPIIRKEYEVRIKGQDSKRVQALFTHRGPLRQFSHMPGRWFSRQWLAFRPEVLRLPTLTLGRAKTLKESDTELDQMRLPSQNVLLMDRHGQYGLRISGTGVQRKSHKPYVLQGSEGEWEGLEPASSRRRLFPEKKGLHQFIATANQRIWVEDHEHLWFPDDRVRRINEVLSMDSDLTREDMENLQMDTHSKFRKILINWVLNNSNDKVFKEKFAAWDGHSESVKEAFWVAQVIYDSLADLLVDRATSGLLPTGTILPYQGLDRLLVLRVVSEPNGLAAFGLEMKDVMNSLLEKVQSHYGTSYGEMNRWKAQHPFVGRIPLLDRFFKVSSLSQWGSAETVNAETQGWGPSVRLVWNMSDPGDSTWMMPAGQSGHIGSKFYDNFRRQWSSGERIKVFPDKHRFGM